jgi:nicotinamidase-related amidase
MKTALLLIDIQDDYFENGTMALVGSDKASKNAKLILERYRANHQTIIHIQHIATSPNATFFRPNTTGAEINNNVKPLNNEKVIVKHYPNSFRDTELADYLNLLEEAKKRDHRRLGRELDLFQVNDEAGPGLIIFHKTDSGCKHGIGSILCHFS